MNPQFCTAHDVLPDLHGDAERHEADELAKPGALRLTAKRGRKRATTALTPRTAVVFLRTWLDRTEFRFSRDQVPSPVPA